MNCCTQTPFLSMLLCSLSLSHLGQAKQLQTIHQFWMIHLLTQNKQIFWQPQKLKMCIIYSQEKYLYWKTVFLQVLWSHCNHSQGVTESTLWGWFYNWFFVACQLCYLYICFTKIHSQNIQATAVPQLVTLESTCFYDPSPFISVLNVAEAS